jgi:lactonase family protein with 7-bladed beta-propeller
VLYTTSAGLGGPNVASFIVDKNTGTLTLSSSLALPVPPRKLAAIEGNLYVIPDPSANAAQMFAFSINGLTAALTQLSPTATLPGPPHDLAIAGFGNNIPSWMGLTFDGTSGGEIQGIVRQPNGGATGLQLGSPTSTGGDSPQGIRVTPDGKFVVVVNQGTSNVSVYSLDASTGALAAVPGSPFASGSAPGPVAIDPSGKFVFVGDTGGNSLSAYTIDSAGSLTPVTGTPLPPHSTRQALERARARARCLNKLRRLEQLSEQRFRAREPWVHAECRWWIHNVRCAGRALRLALPSAIALAAEKAAVPLVLVSRFTRCRSARSSEACW